MTEAGAFRVFCSLHPLVLQESESAARYRGENEPARYECSECSKVYASYQALGKHKTRHPKPLTTRASTCRRFVEVAATAKRTCPRHVMLLELGLLRWLNLHTGTACPATAHHTCVIRGPADDLSSN